MTAKIIEKTVPEQITTPIGIQRELPTDDHGHHAEVRKIGSMRRRPASKAASLGL